MQTPITREELKALLDPLKEDITKVLEGIDRQNGRVRDLEVDVAIIKDRQPGRQAIMWGSAAGGFMAVVGMLMDYLGFHK